jgi:hypothetical protein
MSEFFTFGDEGINLARVVVRRGRRGGAIIMSEFFTFGDEGINLAHVVAWKDDPEKETLHVIFCAAQEGLSVDGVTEIAPYSKTFFGELRYRLLERFWKG